MRRIKPVLLCFFVAVSFFGCRRAPETKGVTLRVAGWGDIEEARIVQGVVAEFQKLHPNVNVQVLRIPFNEYITKILTQAAAGEAPDVIAVNAEQLSTFMRKDVWLDLFPYARNDQDIKLENYYPEALARYTVKGKLIALPRDIAPICVVYYNADAFRKAGLPLPKNDWNTEQFLNTAKALTKKNKEGKTVQWGFVDDWAIWDAWVYTFGGKIVDRVEKPTKVLLDEPEAVRGVQFRADLIHRYKVLPGPASLSAMGGLGNADLFMNGTAAMFYSGIWKTPQFRNIRAFQWDVVQFPKGPGGKRGYPMSAAGYGVMKNTKHPDLAYQLVKFLAGEPGQSGMAETGLTQPALRNLAASPVFLDEKPPKSKAFLVDAVRFGIFQPLHPDVNEWMNLIGSALDRVWSGQETAEQALGRVVPEINRKFFTE